jgi:hypothetical protein
VSALTFTEVVLAIASLTAGAFGAMDAARLASSPARDAAMFATIGLVLCDIVWLLRLL